MVKTVRSDGAWFWLGQVGIEATRSTSLAGQSWGAVYAAGAYDRPGFVCEEKFKDRFKGLIGLSYIAPPSCVERASR